MNAPIPTNGEAAPTQILIVLDANGNLRVSHPPNKIIALGMIAAAQAVITGNVPAPPTIVPVAKFIPPPNR